jgi:hypothetical protein
MLVMLGAAAGEVRVRHINVRHASRIYASPEADPGTCFVFCLECDEARTQPYLARAGNRSSSRG